MGWLQLTYIVPTVPFCVLVLDFCFEDGAKIFMGLDSGWCYAALVADTLVYFALYSYFTALQKNQFGQSVS